MSFLDFLKDVTLEEIPVSIKSQAVAKKQYNPDESVLAIRVWKDGEIYPSKALVDQFCLEYPKATILTEVDENGKEKKTYTFADKSNGFDVIDSRLWGQCKGAAKDFIAVAIVDKELPKVDLFANVKYNDDGSPISSVLSQGAATFGSKTLLPMIKEIYDVEPNEEGYIDLIIDTSKNLKSISTNGLFNFPKKVSRGKHQGTETYERRENVDIFALIPAQLV